MKLHAFQERMIGEAREKLRALRSTVTGRAPRVLVQSPTGSGKCLGRGTPVLMANATIKAVEKVRVGDRLMGPDSKPRTVLSVCTGQEMLYRVTPKRGDPYIVNESHILSLRKTETANAPRGKRRSDFQGGRIINISVRDYLSKSKTFRWVNKGWRAPADFGNAPMPIDPYFLGLWLGDGHSRHASITTGDDEIIEYLRAFAASHGCRVRIEQNSVNSVVAHIVTARGQRNPVLEQLQSMRLIKNKHVPKIVRMASEDDRLTFLAGMVDSDGHLSGGYFDFTLKDRKMANDVAFVARSLGFAAYVQPCRKTCTNNGVTGDYHRLSISGHIDRVPCILPRKKAGPRAINKNVTNVGITVEAIGVGDYFGFEIDGDRLFLLGDFTVTHNTVMASYIVQSLVAKGKTVHFMAHRDFLIDQTGKTFAKLALEYSYVWSGHWYNQYHSIHLAMVQSLRSRLSKIKAPDYLIIDEAHHSAAAMYVAVMDAWPNTVVIGFTATPCRLDGKGLDTWYDALILGPSIKWLIDNRYLSDYIAYAPSTPDMSEVRVRMGEFAADEVDAVMDRAVIIGDIVRDYRQYAHKKRAVYFATSISHSQHMTAAFKAAGYRWAHLDGTSQSWERRDAAVAMARGQLDGICNVDLFGEGFDLAAQAEMDVTIECVGDCKPSKSLGSVMQRWGRLLRYKDYNGILLDHAGNMDRHGLPDDDRTWSLAGVEKKPVETMNCDGCGARVSKHASVCRYCGFKIKDAPVREAGEGRKVEQKDGELHEVDKDSRRKSHKLEEWQAGSIDELRDIAVRRGYQNPDVWAAHMWTDRKQREQARKYAKAQQTDFFAQIAVDRVMGR